MFDSRCVRRFLPVALVALAAAVSEARAAYVEFFTPPGSLVGGQPVDALAKFTTGSNTVTIELINRQSNPTSIIQNVSGLFFTLSTGQTDASISSSSGLERNVNGDKSYVDGSIVPTGWKVDDPVGSQIHLNVLGTPIGPAYTLIGPPGGPTYANANGSIRGNDPHNPFLAESISFVLDVPGVTSASVVSAATFGFGTAAGNNVVGVPEASTWTLVGFAGLVALVARRRVAHYAAKSP